MVPEASLGADTIHPGKVGRAVNTLHPKRSRRQGCYNQSKLGGSVRQPDDTCTQIDGATISAITHHAAGENPGQSLPNCGRVKHVHSPPVYSFVSAQSTTP